MTDPDHRSGFVAVVGRPNVGKSTLVNALVGQKISIVTSKPHTTRHAILGILNQPDVQLVFIDTPGLEARSGKLINLMMNRAAVGALEGADLILFVVEAGRWIDGDQQALEFIRNAGAPCMVAANKIDRVKPRDRLLPYLEQLATRYEFTEFVPISATGGANLDRLVAALRQQLPVREALYGADYLTDRDRRFHVAEVLREKLMQNLQQEVPYGVGVEILQIEEDEKGRLCIDATIWVDRDSHKGIVVGRGGQNLKKIGRAARLEMQETFKQPVRLDSHVRVKKNWADNALALRQLGYDGEL